MKQIRKRIINIAAYQKPSFWKRLKSSIVFLLISAMAFCFVPALSTYASEQDYAPWKPASENIFPVDLSSYFDGYQGSFVLYDQKSDKWDIYNMDLAARRTSPDSTYKIYMALFGLEEGAVTPENSTMLWNQTKYPFEEWNKNQTLDSAMQSSVNWYFQNIDQKLGSSVVKSYIQKVGYGNENMDADFSSYWLQSSLKISPVEQVGLLAKTFTEGTCFSAENIYAVKKSILLSDAPDGRLYGKTGTGCVEEKDVNGWFIGMVETCSNKYFFAANIQSDINATGSKASEIALSVLMDMGILKP